MEPGRLAQDTVLFLKIVDHIFLPLVQPARKRNQKQPKGIKRRTHVVIPNTARNGKEVRGLATSRSGNRSCFQGHRVSGRYTLRHRAVAHGGAQPAGSVEEVNPPWGPTKLPNGRFKPDAEPPRWLAARRGLMVASVQELWFEPMPGSHTFTFCKLEGIFPLDVRILYQALPRVSN